jgi:hypothetical protein
VFEVLIRNFTERAEKSRLVIYHHVVLEKTQMKEVQSITNEGISRWRESELSVFGVKIGTFYSVISESSNYILLLKRDVEIYVRHISF